MLYLPYSFVSGSKAKLFINEFIMKHNVLLVFATSLVFLLSGYAQDKPQRLIADPSTQIQTPTTSPREIKRKVAIGRFSNETQYGKGIFYDRENDPMAKQALDVLSTRLAASGKLLLIESGDIDIVSKELAEGAVSQKIAADYVILGSITQFGRKETGSEGIFTSKKTQTVEASVSLRVVDVHTGLVIYSEEGKGVAETSVKTTLGLGGQAGYDATLSDKAISGAIDQLVENIINKCTNKPWRTYILSADDDGVIIGGGKSQGLREGDVFEIYAVGKKVKNPQTGITIELPGKRVASLRIETMAGDTPETEFSVVSVLDGTFDPSKLEEYYVQAN